MLWLFVLLLPALAAAQGVYPSPEALPALTLRVTGTVYAIAPHGDGYVLGGQFDRINGEPRRNIALIGADGALLDAGFEWIEGGANAIVHRLVVSGDSVYAVGDFTTFNGAPRQYVAKLSLTDGSLDAGFAPMPNAPVRALATDGAGGVFLGGDFSSVNGTPRDNSAKVDASGAVTAWVAGYKDASVVHAIGYDALSGKVYVGGNLRIGGLRRAVARLDGVSGAADPSWNIKVNPRGTPQVFAITLSDDHVYLGGQFSRLANVNRANIARVDRGSGDIDSAWNPGANSAVRSILVDGDGIIAGGDFTRIGGADHQRLGRIAADGLADPAFVVDADRPVRAIVASTSGLLVGGAFRTLNGSPEEGLARLVGYVSDPTFIGTVGGPGQVDAFAFAADGGVFVGGVFDFAEQDGIVHARSNLLRLDPDYGIDTDWVLDVASDVQALAVDTSNGHLYVGGSFPARLQRYDVSGASPVLDAGWNPAADGTVNGLELDAAGLLYVTGEFGSIGGSARNGVARLNGASADGWNPAPDGRIDALALGAGSVWLGGDCVLASTNDCTSNLVRANTGSGAIDSGFDADADGAVHALLVDGSDLYLGGEFATVQGAARASLARIDTVSGDVDEEWAASTSGRVDALALDAANGWVYAGGFFANAGAGAHPNMARASVSDPGIVDPGWRPGSDDAVAQMAVVGSAGDVFIAGRFRSVTNLPAGGVARLVTDGSDSTAIAITSIAPSPSMTGEQYTVSFAVTNLTNEATAPVGSVLVGTDHAEACGPVAVDAGGLGSCTITSNTGGLRQVTAAFGGSAPFLDSLSAPVAHQVFAAVDVTHVDTRIEATDPAAAAGGSDAGAVRVTLVDGAGNPVSGVAVRFAATGSALLASANGVTDAAGQVATTLTDTVQELVEVTAQYDVDGDGTAETAVVNGSPASVVFHGPVDPAQLATRIVATDPLAAADGIDTAAVTVSLVDSAGNPVPGVAVSFSLGSGSAVLSAPGVSNAAGEVDALITNAVPEAVAVTALFDSDGDGTPDDSVDNGSPAAVAFFGAVDPVHVSTRIEATDPGATADGIDTGAVTVTLADSNGTPVQGVAVDFAASGSAVFAAPAGVSDANGEVSTTLTDTIVEAVAVTAQYDADNDNVPETAVANGSPANVLFAAGPVDPGPGGSTLLAATDDTAFANGIDSGAVLLTLTDGSGNPVAGVAVSLAAGGSAVLANASGITDAAGQFGSTLVDAVVETVGVTALFDASGDGIPDTAVVNGSPANVNFVPEAATTIAITAHAPEPSVVGQAYTVSFQAASAATPLGTVLVSDGAGATCNAALAVGDAGAGSCALTATAAGVHALVASFAGAPGFADSVSASTPHDVDAAATALNLSGPSILVEGDTANFTWSLSVVAPGAGTPTGTITVSDGGALSCTAAASVGGCSLVIDAAGAYDFSATYPGDGNFAASAAGPVAVDVQAGGVAVIDIAVRHEIVASGVLFDGTGDLVDYEFEVSNIGTTEQTGVAIDLLMPPEFADIAWTCTPNDAGASCGQPNGSGDIAFSVDLAAGTSVLVELAVRIVDPEDDGVETAASAAEQVDEIETANNVGITFYRSCSSSEVIGERPLAEHVCGFRDGFEGAAPVTLE